MMRTIEKQKQLLINARNNIGKALSEIINAHYYFDDDRDDFIRIISANDLDYAWNLYASLDTAAREDFMDLLEKVGD